MATQPHTDTDQVHRITIGENGVGIGCDSDGFLFIHGQRGRPIAEIRFTTVEKHAEFLTCAAEALRWRLDADRDAGTPEAWTPDGKPRMLPDGLVR